MKRKIAVFACLVLAAGLSARQPVSCLDAWGGKQAELYAFMSGTIVQAEDSTTGTEARPAGLKKKGIGVIASALIPGTGEFYAGSWIKGSLFLAAEAAFWYGNIHFNKKGDDGTEKYEAFADQHWSETRWHKYYNSETDPSTHELPDTKTQQYYEMIGKYDQFAKGWDTWETEGIILSSNRQKYEDMEHAMNQEYKKASTFAALILVNHLFSAADAAWTIHRYNRDITAEMHVGCMEMRGALVPLCGLKVSW
ncbi:hypothetical protein JW906_08380 [bacterium]|nr:hypothetical protein [bacterium]